MLKVVAKSCLIEERLLKYFNTMAGLKKGGFVSRGCGAIMSGRSKKTKIM